MQGQEKNYNLNSPRLHKRYRCYKRRLTLLFDWYDCNAIERSFMQIGPAGLLHAQLEHLGKHPLFMWGYTVLFKYKKLSLPVPNVPQNSKYKNLKFKNLPSLYCERHMLNLRWLMCERIKSYLQVQENTRNEEYFAIAMVNNLPGFFKCRR